ncbi:MAG: TlpA family protein disulfide reductase [Sphingobacteriaceae bacterium]|nr:MAG: TlpA family protein disulfide reductase [Sphingobacteriaceae bacterium]
MPKSVIYAVIVTVVLFLNPLSGKAQRKTTFAYSVQAVQIGTFNINYKYTYLFALLKKDNTGTTYQCTLIGAKAGDDKAKGITVDINTDSIRKTRLSNSGVLEQLAMLNRPFTITVDDKGKISAVSGIKEVLTEAATKWQLQPGITNQLTGNINALQASIQNMFLPLPDKKITFGSEWDHNDLHYRVTGIKGATLEIAVTRLNGNVNNTITGKYVYNDVTGLIEHAETQAKVIDEKARPVYISDYTYKQTIRYDAKMEIVDTAWINMAVKASYWSDALKNGFNLDSAKAFSFFAANDIRFKNDVYYRAFKLSAIQQLEIKDRYKIYESLLAATPNKLLDGNESHLFNKMSPALAMSADSAYDVVKYFYKTPSFNPWLQQSFAQIFINNLNIDDFKKAMRERGLSETEIDKTLTGHQLTQVNSKALLDMMNRSKNPELEKTVNPLYLWVQSLNKPNDISSLIKTAAAFEYMKDEEMKLGNGGRYALMVYDMLNKSGQKKEANTLLDKIIIKLQTYTADTLNANRYADQSLLAHAYYLKYNAAKPADSVKALKYLAKAAQYSPKTNAEKAYASFYDRHFLGSKESYRQEFIERLFNSGDETQALAIFAEQINAQPESIDEMEKIYAAHFPGKKFEEYFTKNVVSAWQPAPDFKLTGVDGKEQMLNTYRKKWLVLDFWGTWCGPCRQEMPQINAFNNDVVKGQYPNINFLSIACFDTDAKVKAFLAENNYSIPVLMSDGLVQGNYKIKGYPSKILITPDGKMININFGADWLGILKKFDQLYTSN